MGCSSGNQGVWWIDHPPPPSSLRARNWSSLRFWPSRRAELDNITWRTFDKKGVQFVYFMEFGRLVKVGVSKYPWWRLSVIESELKRYPGLAHVSEAAGPGAELTIEDVAFGGLDLETAIHRYLMRDHFSGEWFWRCRRLHRVQQHLLAQGLLFGIDEVYPLDQWGR